MIAKQVCLIAASVLLGLNFGSNNAGAQPAPDPERAAHLRQLMESKPKTSDMAPSGFTAPVYRNNVIETKYSQTDGHSGTSLTASEKTKDAPATVYQWYQNALQADGWNILPTQPSTNANLAMAKAQKDDAILFFYCTRNKATPGYSLVTITVSTKAPGAR
jgi:hypothetical protein